MRVHSLRKTKLGRYEHLKIVLSLHAEKEEFFLTHVSALVSLILGRYEHLKIVLSLHAEKEEFFYRMSRLLSV